jgi:hypothetical protein
MSSYHVFLSYSDQDAELMKRISHDLHVEKLKVTVNESIVTVTPSMNRVIGDRMRSANAFVFILSPEALTADGYINRLEYAASLKKPLYLVSARGDENTALPAGFSAGTWIDLREDYGGISNELIPKLLNDFGMEKTMWKVDKSKLLKAMAKLTGHAEPSRSRATTSSADVSFNAHQAHHTKWKEHTRNVLLVVLFLLGLYCLWINLVPLIGQ